MKSIKKSEKIIRKIKCYQRFFTDIVNIMKRKEIQNSILEDSYINIINKNENKIEAKLEYKL